MVFGKFVLQDKIGSSVCGKSWLVGNFGKRFYATDNHGRCRRSVREDGK